MTPTVKRSSLHHTNLQSAMRSESHRVIAIDGPAASGKSSVAQELARRLRFVYVNSGAMYRAITWHVLEHGVSPSDASAITRPTENAAIACHLRDNESLMLID